MPDKNPYIPLNPADITLTPGDGAHTATVSPLDFLELEQVQDVAFSFIKEVEVLRRLKRCSFETGESVRLLPEYSFMPVLIDAQSHPVFLYQLIETIDEYVDIDRILEEFPQLNYSQVVGAIQFLRKVAQLNSRGIDIDELEDQHLLENNENLIEAFKDKEMVRVLTQPE